MQYAVLYKAAESWPRNGWYESMQNNYMRKQYERIMLCRCAVLS